MAKRTRSSAIIAAATAFLLSVGSSGIFAQVGHQPESSPYRDLRIKQTVTFMGGMLSGGRGKAGVGPSSGPLLGLRWDAHVGGSLALFLGAYGSDLERRLINPILPPGAGRELGTAQQNVWMAEGGINLLLTGRKTWHGFAPYAGAGLGMVFGTEVPEDSVFTFGRKFHIGPAAGIRYFLSRRFHIRLEARDIIWRMSYPQVFLTIPEDDPQIPVIDGDVSTLAEWVHHPTFFFGLGWTLRL